MYVAKTKIIRLQVLDDRILEATYMYVKFGKKHKPSTLSDPSRSRYSTYIYLVLGLLYIRYSVRLVLLNLAQKYQKRQVRKIC